MGCFVPELVLGRLGQGRKQLFALSLLPLAEFFLCLPAPGQILLGPLQLRLHGGGIVSRAVPAHLQQSPALRALGQTLLPLSGLAPETLQPSLKRGQLLALEAHAVLGGAELAPDPEDILLGHGQAFLRLQQPQPGLLRLGLSQGRSGEHPADALVERRKFPLRLAASGLGIAVVAGHE